MKKFPKHIKYIIFSLTIFTASFSFVGKASADTYAYTCADNSGYIASDVNLVPGLPPYVFQASQTFTASAQITSTCDDHVQTIVSLAVQNSSDGIGVELIPTAIITLQPGILPSNGVPATTTFTAPSTDGSYYIRFTTYVDEQQPQQGPGDPTQPGGGQGGDCTEDGSAGCGDNPDDGQDQQGQDQQGQDQDGYDYP